MQGSLSRKKFGSANWEKARIRLAKEYEKTADIRKDFQHKLANKLADHGGILVKVPGNYPSSQLCSCCGKKEKSVKNLAVRRWERSR